MICTYNVISVCVYLYIYINDIIDMLYIYIYDVMYDDNMYMYIYISYNIIYIYNMYI